MGDLMIRDAKRLQISQNGGPNLNQTGVDNPAFRVLDLNNALARERYTGNHLIYRSRNEDNIANDIINFYNSSGKSSLFLQKFATVRQTSHMASSRRRETPGVDLGQSQTLSQRCAPITFMKTSTSGTILRQTYLKFGGTSKRRYRTGKQDCISFFDIETDKVSTYQYRPGENITGVINIIVRKNLDIRFVELVVTGQGQFKRRVSGDGFPQTFKEVYLHKEKCVLGDSDADLRSILIPGQYTSQFRVKLPGYLPSTIHHQDDVNGFTCDISYVLKVRLCDDAGVASPWSTSTPYNRVRVFMEKQIQVNVQRGFDLSAIPDAMNPIIHKEQVYLACTHEEAAIVTLHIDRAVFLAGDDIQLHLQVSLPSSQRVKDIKCRLQEHVITNTRHDPIVFTLSKIIRKDPYNIDGKSSTLSREQNFVVTIPTQTQLISPYSLGNSRIKVEYTLTVNLRFTPAGGKLSFKIPVGIGPCAEPIYVEKISSRKAIPLFNRTIRFPCFSAPTLPDSSSTRPSNAKSAASVVITTKYSNGLFARCFLCCVGGMD